MLRLSVAGVVGTGVMPGAITPGTARSAVSQTNPAKPDQIQTRVFWTWDHSTEWVLNRSGAQTIGASNHYGRTTENFVDDYKRLLEWSGKHHIDAVVIWGLLRDTHGGVESAKKLCDVANKNGVKLLCGVGLNAYGGVYYEGNSEFCLENHLTSHPDLYGLDANGNKMAYSFGIYGPRTSHHACPSRKENQEYAVESLKWLFKTLPGLGGVQIESGDTGVCVCELCKKRRQKPASSLSWEDMALMYPIAVGAIRSEKPDAFIICETYSHPQKLNDTGKAPGFGDGRPAWSDESLAKFPENVYVQWAGDQYFKPNFTRRWTDTDNVTATRKNIMRAHFGTYWWGGIRGELAIDWIADMVQQSMKHGMDGISIFGEVSPFETGAELNYLAFENYGSATNPNADLDIFLKDVAGSLLGGEEAAKAFLNFSRMTSDVKKIPGALKDIYKRCAKLPPDEARRWTWLAKFLASSIY
jgi:hypothetical protein